MILQIRFLEPIGFKRSSIWTDDATPNFMYKQYPKSRAVMCISNLCPWEISLFRMNAAQYKEFLMGTLGLTPPGCCNATGGRSLTRCEILRSQAHKNHADVIDFVREMETKHRLQ